MSFASVNQVQEQIFVLQNCEEGRHFWNLQPAMIKAITVASSFLIIIKTIIIIIIIIIITARLGNNVTRNWNLAIYFPTTCLKNGRVRQQSANLPKVQDFYFHQTPGTVGIFHQNCLMTQITFFGGAWKLEFLNPRTF
jgi:hypothetical protein